MDKQFHHWIHFSLTSEDVNNLSYTLMWSHALKQIYTPAITKVHRELKRIAKKYHSISMLSMTHGQPATPTTFGKEVSVFCKRLERQIVQLKRHKRL